MSNLLAYWLATYKSLDYQKYVEFDRPGERSPE